MICPLVPISFGELLDKISILQIKSEKTDNTFVHKELKQLIFIAEEYKIYSCDLLIDLKQINIKLWEIEDKLREHEKMWVFDEDFIDLARQVYFLNDKRASIKKKINLKFNSDYQEVKLYK